MGRWSRPTLPQLAGLRRSLHSWLAEVNATGLDENGIVALVTSTMRDFSERRGTDGDRGGRNDGQRPVGGVA